MAQNTRNYEKWGKVTTTRDLGCAILLEYFRDREECLWLKTLAVFASD